MKTILIADDEKEYLDILETKLKSLGYATLTASDGAAALDLLLKNTVDLVLLDLVMPQKDGQTFMYFFQKNHMNIPIIILTNLSQTALPDMKYDYLVKSNTSLDEIVRLVQMRLDENISIDKTS